MRAAWFLVVAVFCLASVVAPPNSNLCAVELDKRSLSYRRPASVDSGILVILVAAGVIVVDSMKSADCLHESDGPALPTLLDA